MEESKSQPQPENSEGLLAGITSPTDVVATQEVTIDHRVPEESDTPADRPAWWPENFWKKEDAEPDLEAIAKSWTDLRKQISQGKHKAPADGNYDYTAFGSVPDTDPVRQHVEGWAKEYGVSQAALDSLVGKVVELNASKAEVSNFNAAEEKKSLGANSDAIIKGMVEWANGLVNKGVWGPDDFNEFKVMGGTANGIKALMKLRQSYEGRIPMNSAPIDGAPSKDELYQMVSDPRYKTDVSYRAKVEKMFAAQFNN